MDSYKKALTFAVELFGRDHVNSESSDGLFETVINLSEYRHVGNGYKPSIIRLSYDGSYYWMDIDDYKWEFDDNANPSKPVERVSLWREERFSRN